jgi:hypothetical protein
MEPTGVSGREANPAVLVADGPMATTVGSRDRGAPVEDTGDRMVPRWAWWVGVGLLIAQLIGMLVFSTVQYSRYSLTGDFATYSQAWWAIAHGQLDPFTTGLGVPFWKNNAEFAMWPLSLLYYVDPHPVVLLWLQDTVVVITELIAFRWIVEVIEGARSRIPGRVAPWLALGAAGVVVINPCAYETIAFDFHMEPMAALFALLAGYDLWAGRTRRLWWWVPLALLSTAVGGIYLLGVGISGMLAGPRTRRPGALIAGVGLAWVFALSAVGGVGVGGKTFTSSYGYLVGPHNLRIGIVDVVLGALGHPASVIHVALSNGRVVFAFLVVAGLIGVVSPWGFGLALVVLVPNLLDGSGIFVRFGASFQSWPAMPFILVGSVMVLLRVFERRQKGDFGRRMVRTGLVVWLVLFVEFAALNLPSVPRVWLSVDATTAGELARIETVVPPKAEVISSETVIGRFAERDSVYPYLGVGQTFPVNRPRVVFVLTPEAVLDNGLPIFETMSAIAFVRHRLHARILMPGSDVDAFAWSPPPGTRRVTLP